MPSTQIEAQARSGVVLAFRPRAPEAAPRPAASAPGWVPNELGMVRAVLLALAVAAGPCGAALALRGAGPPRPVPGRAAPACATAAGPPAQQVEGLPAGGGAGAGNAGLSARCPLQ